MLSARLAKVRNPFGSGRVETWLVGSAFRMRGKALKLRQGNWVLTRFAAELSDGIIRSSTLLDPLDPVVVSHAPVWKRFAVSCALASHYDRFRLDPGLTPNLASQEYRANRLGPSLSTPDDPETGYETQIDYLWRKGRRAHRQSHAVHVWATWLSVGAVTAVILGLIMATWDILSKRMGVLPGPVSSIVGADLLKYSMPIVFPAAVSLCTAIWLVQDSGRREKRYAQVCARLERYAARLRVQAAPADIEETIRSCEDLLLDELIDWETVAVNMSRVE